MHGGHESHIAIFNLTRKCCREGHYLHGIILSSIYLPLHFPLSFVLSYFIYLPSASFSWTRLPLDLVPSLFNLPTPVASCCQLSPNRDSYDASHHSFPRFTRPVPFNSSIEVVSSVFKMNTTKRCAEEISSIDNDSPDDDVDFPLHKAPRRYESPSSQSTSKSSSFQFSVELPLSNAASARCH